jgi:hypothetical protein
MCERIEYYTPRHFKAYEFVPPEVYAELGRDALHFLVDVRTLITADQLRDFFGVPVLINDWYWKKKQGVPSRKWKTQRGYRPPKSRTGARWSQHRFGRALDATVVGVSATEVRDIVVNHPSVFPYVTRVEDKVNWLHADCANVFHHGIQLFKP